MNRPFLSILSAILVLVSIATTSAAQSLRSLGRNHFRPFYIDKLVLNPDGFVNLKGEVPLITLLLDSVSFQE